jgi:hypothetical protein
MGGFKIINYGIIPRQSSSVKNTVSLMQFGFLFISIALTEIVIEINLPPSHTVPPTRCILHSRKPKNAES